MEITIEKIFEPALVAVISTHGDIDASNYLELVAKAQELYRSGIRDVLIDLGDTSFLSSSGLVALHSIALLMRGEKPHDPEEGWGAIHAMTDDVDSGFQKHVKLLNPQPRVVRTLEASAFNLLFEIYTDREGALASFRPESTQTAAG